MRPFTYVRATDEARAITEADAARSEYIAGGTSLIDLMKLDVEQPAILIDINPLSLSRIEEVGDRVRIGALAKNSVVAEHPLIQSRYPMLSEALLSGASPQLRNMASVGGNLLQRTRCPYFRDVSVAECNKRKPGSGCAAQDGYNRSHAILGGSAQCIATHPSDMCVALLALDAVVHIRRLKAIHPIPIADFHLAPEDHPHIENVLEHGQLIVDVELPPSRFASRSRYLKVRDRASYEFALASAAIGIDLVDRVIRDARIAMGGVGTKPWRNPEAEHVLIGQSPSDALFQRAARIALAGAVPKKHNAFKVELMQRTIVRGLQAVSSMAGGVT